MAAAWIVCLGRHTICQVWETTDYTSGIQHELGIPAAIEEDSAL
jgi:hypothetical protein